jgi:hypothetical protein
VIDGGKYALDQLPQANEAEKDFEGR